MNPALRKHKWVDTTGGPARQICRRCGKFRGEGECTPPPVGLLTHVSKHGIEVFNIWKSFGVRK